MHKRIFLLTDEVIHWNIVPEANKKHIFMESWGKHSFGKILTTLQTCFNQSGANLDWSVLANEQEINPAENISPAQTGFNHAFVTWKMFSQGNQDAWRIDEIDHAG